MSFLKIINNKKITLISIFLFLYVLLNFLDGERGLISYFEKKNTINNLLKEKKLLTNKLNLIEKKNSMLTDVIDLDYLETIYREKFLVGKKNEKVFFE
ncbi:MAG TPA: septation ring formation regulator EzrA [Candidatus Pelagibacter sp.]|jgi:cell division protein FtsB|nr:septation ring formation regulator EzrA [Candidatus Pelagibacter sp.]